MQNFSFLGDVQVVFPWWKKRKEEKNNELPVLMATLASAQTELSRAGVGLRLTNNSISCLIITFPASLESLVKMRSIL